MTNEHKGGSVDPLYSLWKKGSITKEVLEGGILQNLRNSEEGILEGRSLEQMRISRMIAEWEASGQSSPALSRSSAVSMGCQVPSKINSELHDQEKE